MRIRDPKTTALIFASGKMVVTGAKSEDDSRLASRKYARIIQKLGFDAKFAEFKIQNIVGSCDVKFPIRLEGLAFSHGAFSSYEPEVCFVSSSFFIFVFLFVFFFLLLRSFTCFGLHSGVNLVQLGSKVSGNMSRVDPGWDMRWSGVIGGMAIKEDTGWRC